MSKAIFFARDPAGANVIAPVIRRFINAEGWTVEVYAKEFAIPRLRNEGYQVCDISEKIGGISLDSVGVWISEMAPDVIITGSSVDDFTERYIWKAAEEQQICSYAIMDQWTNLGIRFSPYDYSGLTEYGKNPVNPYLPRQILVMDELAKRMLIQDKVPEDRIAVTGQPHFDTIKEKYRSAIRNVKQEECVRILFASEPKSTTVGDPEYWGYDEKSIFEAYYRVLGKLADDFDIKIHIMIRPHPRENKDNWTDIISSYRRDKVELSLDDKSDSFTLMKNADVVCGISSMFLVEAIICNVPTVSCLIGLKQESPFVFDRIGVYDSCRTEGELYQRLKSIMIDKEELKIDIDFIEDAAQKVWEYIQENLGHGNISN